MTTMVLANCKPQEVLQHFEAISQIPRGSGNEKAVSDYIANFAKNLGLKYIQDKLNNLIIFKPATVGYENSPAVILQAHLDMVCEKNAGTNHDFLKDPIKLYIDGDKLKAHGTTLGADNGIGVALSMAVLESTNLQHPPIEVILTVDEEAGMTGANFLDTTTLKAKKMINLDSGDETEFTMGCAAGSMAEYTLPVNWNNTSSPGYKVSVTGLKGGHSGGDITDDRGNAMGILAHVLSRLNEKYEGIGIASVSGGMKVNAIPREAEAIITIEKCSNINEAKDLLQLAKAEFLKTYNTTDLNITIEESTATKVIDNESCEKLLASLLLMPLGVISMSREIECLPNASCNIGVLETLENAIKISVMPRGSANHFIGQTETKIKHLAKLTGSTVVFTQRSPAWPYDPNSALLKVAMASYEKVFNRTAKVTATPGGLECGLLSEKIPELDIIAFGPTSVDIHTPEEWLSIKSTENVWIFLQDILRNLK